MLIAAAGLGVLHAAAPALAHGLSHARCRSSSPRSSAGLIALVQLYLRHFLLARLAGGAAVTAIIWAWAAAQYPFLLQPRLTITAAAATQSVLLATLICLGVGAVLLVPSLAWLYVTFQRRPGGS